MGTLVEGQIDRGIKATKEVEHINIVKQPLSPSTWQGLCSKCRFSLEYECKLVGLERIYYQVGIDNGVCNLVQPQTLNEP